jgi:hypothetical protein
MYRDNDLLTSDDAPGELHTYYEDFDGLFDGLFELNAAIPWTECHGYVSDL